MTDFVLSTLFLALESTESGIFVHFRALEML